MGTGEGFSASDPAFSRPLALGHLESRISNLDFAIVLGDRAADVSGSIEGATMENGLRYLAPPGRCSYLPDQTARMEYETVVRLSPQEYLERMDQGWRRFGRTLFRPRCSSCLACRPIRVDVARFRPDRSQRRSLKANRDEIRLEIGRPSVSSAKLDLHDRYHSAQTEAKGWPAHSEDASGYWSAFVDNPFPTREWLYYLGDALVGVGYVDDLPTALSAIYFFHDPVLRDRSLGTLNALSVIEKAAEWDRSHVYLGYYVEGCRSMAYKARFRPNQVLAIDGRWHEFRSREPSGW